MSFSKTFSVLGLCVTGLVACGSDSKSSSTETVTGPSISATSVTSHEAAQASHESADNAASSDDVTAQQEPTSSHVAMSIDAETLIRYAQLEPRATRRDTTFETQITTSFNILGCTAAFDGEFIGSLTSYALNANVTYDSNTCLRSRKVSGTAFLAATRDANGRTVSFSEDMNQTLANGDTIHITSQDANSATYTLTSDAFASAGNVISAVAVNEHRVRTAADGNVVFDFSIHTDSNDLLRISTGFAADANSAITTKAAQTRTIISGTNTLVHNIAHYTAKHTFDNLARATQTCLCPSAGSMTEDVTYEGTDAAAFTRIYTFTGCGTASVDVTASTDPNVLVGTTQVSWDACN